MNNEKLHQGCASSRKHAKIIRSIAKVVLNVRKYFANEKKGNCVPIQKVIERTAPATNISKSAIRKIRTESNLIKFNADGVIVRETQSQVPDVFISIIRNVISELIRSDRVSPSLPKLFEKLQSQSYEFFNEKPEWIWCAETIRSFLLHNGFVSKKRKPTMSKVEKDRTL